MLLPRKRKLTKTKISPTAVETARTTRQSIVYFVRKENKGTTYKAINLDAVHKLLFKLRIRVQRNVKNLIAIKN